MGRFFNLESALVLLGCMGLAIGGCFALGLDPLLAVGLGLIAALLAFLPAAAFVQDKLIEIYAGRGQIDRALALAVIIRESAPNTRMRNRAYVDVALLHLLRRDHPRALENLEKVKLSLVDSGPARAVVEGHLAYCLAHLQRDLERAEEHARSAVKAVPTEPMFTYFLGLTLLQRGQAAEAEPLITRSLAENPDADEPFAGERAWALARAQLQLGRSPEPARSQAVAAGGYFAEEAKKLGGPAPAVEPVPSP
jgi:tetratricopeptide (TPR) repeat protein